MNFVFKVRHISLDTSNVRDTFGYTLSLNERTDTPFTLTVTFKRTLQNRAFVQILHFRDFKILTYG